MIHCPHLRGILIRSLYDISNCFSSLQKIVCFQLKYAMKLCSCRNYSSMTMKGQKVGVTILTIINHILSDCPNLYVFFLFFLFNSSNYYFVCAGVSSHMDDEYKWAGVEDPKIMVTTSRDPSSRLKMFTKVRPVSLW